MLPAGGRGTYWYMIGSGKVTNQDPNFDWKDFPGEGHLNGDQKDKEALTRQLGVGDSLGRGKSLYQCSLVERKIFKKWKGQ